MNFSMQGREEKKSQKAQRPKYDETKKENEENRTERERERRHSLKIKKEMKKCSTEHKIYFRQGKNYHLLTLVLFSLGSSLNSKAVQCRM